MGSRCGYDSIPGADSRVWNLPRWRLRLRESPQRRLAVVKNGSRTRMTWATWGSLRSRRRIRHQADWQSASSSWWS